MSAEVIVVTSGKGGVGKTTTSAAIAMALAERGYKTCAVDFDVGLRNLDLLFGCERRVVFDFVNVIRGEANINQALIRYKKEDGNSNLYIFATSQTNDKTVLEKGPVCTVMDELREQFDYIVCDSPAGIEDGALTAMYHADRAIIVTNPEISSVRDSDRIIGILNSRTRRAENGDEPVKEHLMLTRYNPERVATEDMLSSKDVCEILKVPLIGVIPESQDVLNASNKGRPVTLDGKSEPALAYQDAVDRMFGEDKPMRFIEARKRGVFSRLFGRAA